MESGGVFLHFFDFFIEKRGEIVYTLSMNNKKYLINLIKSILNLEQPNEKSDDVSFEEIFKLSKIHNIANMTYYGVVKLKNKPSKGLMELWKQEYNIGLAKDVIQANELSLLSSLFEKEKIKHIPLKGFELKKLYPKSDMRQMADLDILISEEDKEKVKYLMLKMGYTIEHYGTGKDDGYIKPPFLHVEIHNNLFVEYDSYFYNYFYEISTLEKINFKTGYVEKFNGEDDYLYNFVHIVNHFKTAGTGVRSVMDFWLYKEKFKDTLDWGYINQSLKNLKLEKFHSIFSRLADSWFKEEKFDPLLEELGKYILNAGVYGTNKERVLNVTIKTGKGQKILNKIKIVLSMTFPKRKIMESQYPALKKRGYLLLFYYFVRIFKLLIFKRKEKIAIAKRILNLDEKDIDKREQFFKDIGLDDLYKIKR